MRFFLVPLLLMVMLAVRPVLALEISNSLSSSEAYKAALLPLSAARAQQNNLTEADEFALGVGMGIASPSE
jgi:hypothetical protein